MILTFDLVTPQLIEVIYWSCTICILSLKFLSLGILKLLIRTEMVGHLVIVTLTFDLVSPKSIGVIYWSWIIYTLSLKIIGLCVFKLLNGNNLDIQVSFDLDLWPSDPRINRVIYWSWPIYVPTLKIIYPCILLPSYLSEIVYSSNRPRDGLTNSWTNRMTCAKQYTPSSLKGGIIICVISITD